MSPEVNCDECGETFERTQYEIDAYENHFCDNSCKNEWLKTYSQGENNPNYNGGPVTIECEWCGEETEKERRNIERDDKHFCNQSCNATYYSRVEGEGFGEREDNPEWKGGATENPRYYGPNWSEQREKALERDSRECTECGTSEQLMVHHITGRSDLDTTEPGWWKEANQLDNLKTMCRSCHKELHHEQGDYEHVYGFGEASDQ
jgi:hypothetical protein